MQKKHAATAFNGEGARLFGGRWNGKGTPMVYTASTLSLAALEMLVHLESDQILQAYLCIPIEFGAALCQTLAQADLPTDWHVDPIPASTQDLGNRWVISAASVVLAVPSVLVPVEHNFLLNPQHPEFSKIKIGAAEVFHYDPRLLKNT